MGRTAGTARRRPALAALALLALAAVPRAAGLAIGISIDVVRIDSLFVPPDDSMPAPLPGDLQALPQDNSTFVYEDGGVRGVPGSWTVLKQYIAQNETIRVVPGTGTDVVPHQGIKGQLIDFGNLCSLPNMTFPSPLGFPYIGVVYHLDETTFSTQPPRTEFCTLERKLEMLRAALALSSNVATNTNSTRGLVAAIFVSPLVADANGTQSLYVPPGFAEAWKSVGLLGWVMEERSGLALVDLIARNTRFPVKPAADGSAAPAPSRRHFRPTGTLHRRDDSPQAVLGTVFGPNSPVYQLSPSGTMYSPYRQPFLISLVVVLVVLVVGLGYFFWRGARRGYWTTARNSRNMVQLTMIPAKSNDTLREEELSELPTRVFSPKSGKPPVPRRASAPDARLPPALSSATLSDPTDPTAGPDPRPSLSPSARPSLSSRRAPSPAPTVGTLNVPSCPICLEPFEDGDELRTLRCGHELHTSCVDPWLLGRSGRCPVCRGDNRNPDAAPPPEAPEVAEPPAAVQAPVPAPQGRRGLGAVWAAIEAEAEWVRRSARVHRERRQREREAENAGGEAPQREEAAVPAGEAQA